MKWQEEFKKKFNPIYSGDMSGGYDAMPYLLEYIESLLEEQRKEAYRKGQMSDIRYKIGYVEGQEELINQILSEAPEDKNTPYFSPHTLGDEVVWAHEEGSNQANQQWRESLTKHLI